MEKATKTINFSTKYTNVSNNKLSARVSNTINDVLVSNNAVGVVVGQYDENLSIEYVSDFLLELIGQDPLNFLNIDNAISLYQFIHKDDARYFEFDYFKDLKGKFDFRMVDLDDNPRFVHAYKEDSIDEQGNLIWIMSIRASDDIKSLKVLNKMFDNGLWRISFDTDGDIYKVYYSDKFRQMLGYIDEKELPNHINDLLKLVHPWDVAYLKHMFNQAISDPTHEFEFKCQARILNKNGKYVWYELNSDINWRANGTIYEIIGVIVNIDRTKNAQLEVEHFQAFHEAYSSTNLAEYYININDGSFDRLKVDRILSTVFNESKTWKELIHNFIDYYVVEEDREALKIFYNLDYIKKEFSLGKIELSQESRIIVNGQEKIVRNVVMKGRIEDNGELNNIVAFIRDITDSKKAAEERESMIESNTSLNQLIQGMVKLADLFITVDLDEDTYDIYDIDESKDVKGCYSEYLKTFDEKFETLTSPKKAIELYSPESLRNTLVDENTIIRHEYSYKDREKIEHVSFIPVRWNEDGLLTKVLIIGQDITEERKRDAQAQLALKDALDIADKANRSKTEFLSNMSHDIRTPMNAIVGMTAIAGAHINEKDRVKDSLNKITTSSRHLLALINEVLDMSRIESGKVTLADEEINLPELIDNLIYMVTPDMNKHKHEFEVKLNNLTHEDVYGDSLRIQQIFTNLISNAIKYTPNGGKISFTMSERPTNHADIGCYEFVVEDNGMGMSEDFLKIIFEPFSRSDDKRTSEIQGTGLGMAITKNIVNMMNGEIKVESKLNEGSKFTVTIFLKIHDKAHERVEELIDLPVLIVDDDLSCCEGTCTILNQIGMKAEYVLSGNQAIDVICKHHNENNDYFVVIMDWKMPDLDGIETTKVIRKEVGDKPLILLSSFDYSEIETQARNAGVDGFIAKPLFKSRLTATFKQLLNKNINTKEVNDLENIAKEDFSSKRILLVEDNELNREIAREIISTTGCLIEEATNGKEALDIVNDKPEDYYDLIFMDIQMPIMNGYQAASGIRALANDKGKKMPIIAMTANAFAEDVVMAKNAGMNEHIAKPINIDKLREVMHKWLSN